tara:strand:+ start:251 stop:505 length:255 start_codon:yes stop_codon:yes gene_type:complete
MNYFTFNDISKMRNNNKIIIIRKNIVYDVTNFVKNHPGGEDSIIKNQYFDNQKNYKFHKENGKKEWDKYKIGLIQEKNDNCKIM